jgi:hypothetical protein
MAGAETWHRILNAIERLQAKAPKPRATREGGTSPQNHEKDRANGETEAHTQHDSFEH